MTVQKYKMKQQQKQLTYNTKFDTRANKLVALVFLFIGIVTVVLSHDVTFFVFSLLIAVPLFFEKRNWIVKRIVSRPKFIKESK